MKTSKPTEILLIVLTLLPFLYLGLIYSSLPEEVPMHFDASGAVDRYGNKMELWMLPVIVMLPIYFILKYAPLIDPKKSIEKMGANWNYFKLFVTLAMAALSIGIIYVSYSNMNELSDAPLPLSWIYAIVGILFVVMGNYMPALKPNYFVGIRTPWTLENDLVWRKTHRLGGKLFIAVGLIILLSVFLFSDVLVFWVLIGTTVALTLITFIYSYRTFKNISHE